MSKKRTEEEVVTQAGIEVVLGGKTYEIKPLVIRGSREWRKKLIGLIGQLPSISKVSMDDPDGFAAALEKVAITMSDEVADLFFEYAPNIPREEVETTSTEAELAAAFQEVMRLAFPLAQTLPNVLRAMNE